MSNVMYLITGSIMGGLSRYYLGGLIDQRMGTAFPYGTLVVNISACFLVGVFSVILDEKFHFGPQARLLMMTGFCGAYSTFSTYMLETSNLFITGQMLGVWMNILLSTGLGFLALCLGVLAGRLI